MIKTEAKLSPGAYAGDASSSIFAFQEPTMCHRPADLDLGRGKRNMELAGPLKVTFITGERG